METSLVILGTRLLAEEVCDLVSEIPGYQVIAFVENLERERCGEPLRGLPVRWVDTLTECGGTVQAICALSTTQRCRYVEQVHRLGISFATLSHPTARISRTAEVGTGCFISPFVNISAWTQLGVQVFVNRGVLLGHHTSIGDYCTLQPGVNIAGKVTIGAQTYLGMGAVVRDHITIGKGCVIGAGAVVVNDLPDHVLAMGVPARIIQSDIEEK